MFSAFINFSFFPVMSKEKKPISSFIGALGSVTIRKIYLRSNAIGELQGFLSSLASLSCKTSADLSIIKEFLYTVRATIVHIYSELPTTYRSCITSNKRMIDEARDRYGCPNSRCINREGKTTYRYKLKVGIKDQSDRIDITIFNKDAEEILRMPATTIRQMYAEDDGLSKIQDLFRKTYNKTFKFTFKVDRSSYEYIRRGSYTLHQIEWVPKALQNPQQLLSQPSQLLTDSVIQSSSSAKQHILPTPSTIQTEVASPDSNDETSSSDHSNTSTNVTTSSKNTSSNEE